MFRTRVFFRIRINYVDIEPEFEQVVQLSIKKDRLFGYYTSCKLNEAYF